MDVRTRRDLAIVAGAVLLAALLGLAAVRWLLPPPAAPAALDPRQAALATEFLDRLQRDDIDGALAMVEPGVREKLVGMDFAAIWRALPEQLGTLQSRGAPRGERIGEQPVVTFPLRFERMALDARVGFDAENRINGFRMVPAQAEPPPPPPDDAPYSEREVALAAGGPDLPGVLTLPRGEGPFPAVVLVHGSGPLDRHETIGPNRPFLEIARALAGKGIASLRYDKRTLVAPQTVTAADFTIDIETVDDAVAAVEYLRAMPAVDADRVYVVGHSLGAMLAPRIVQRTGAAGAALLAAPARPLPDIIVEQFGYLAAVDGTISEAEQAAIDDARVRRDAAAALAAGTDPGAALPLDYPAAYWRSVAGYDPVAVARAIGRPLLVIHAGRDYQVTDADFARWQEAFADDPRVRLLRLPALNHLFQAGDGPSRPEEYFVAGRVDERVTDALSEWILDDEGAP